LLGRERHAILGRGMTTSLVGEKKKITGGGETPTFGQGGKKREGRGEISYTTSEREH